MPMPLELQPLIEQFGVELRAFSRSADGKALRSDLAAFVVAPAAEIGQVTESVMGATATARWFARMPGELALHDALPLLAPDKMTATSASKSLGSALGTLHAGIRSLLQGGALQDELLPQKLLQGAFGTDPVSAALRKPFGPGPKLPPLDLPKAVDVEALVRKGALLDALRQFAQCGTAASDAKQSTWTPRFLGQVVKIDPPRACPGDTVVIHFTGLGATPPDLSDGSRLVLRLASAFGLYEYIDLDQLQPGISSSGWRDAGELKLVLPTNASSGCVDIMLLPPPPPGEGGPHCLLGALDALHGTLHAAGLGGAARVLTADLTAAAFHALGLAVQTAPACVPGGPSWLWAGPPRIRLFQVLEPGPVHPRGYLTLQWEVENAEKITIAPFTAADSPTQHELPALAGPLSASGSLRLAVKCTRHWSGGYRLQAANDQGCKGNPAEASVPLASGWGRYRVGTGKVRLNFRPDATSPAYPMRMAGFADEQQVAQSESDPVHARAFVIEALEQGPASAPLAIAVADIWTCTLAVKKEVLRRLAVRFGASRYRDENVLIAGTHTHAVPGGYSDYFLYNFSIGGFDARVFEIIVTGLVEAIAQADRHLAPGALHLHSGIVEGCGENRSIEAFRLNKDVGHDDRQAVDRTMTILVLSEHRLGHKTPVPVGLLDWYAIHPTSLGYMNTGISGDSKGWAEALVEIDRPGLVAAFANANAGDISGNVGHGIPLGSPADPGRLDQDRARMMLLGRIQALTALSLIHGPGEELAGPLDCRLRFVDMDNQPVAAAPGERTWPAAIGVSFGAGSSEDGQAAVYLGPVKLLSKIQEGVTHAVHNKGAVEFAAIGGPVLHGLMSVLLLSLVALATGAAGATALGVTQALAGAAGAMALLQPSPGASWFFGLLGKFAFNSKVIAPAPSGDFRWEWIPPDPVFFPPDFAHGHGDKPILFPAGLWKLRRTPLAGGTAQELECPLVPHRLPMQVLRIGQLLVVGVPAEFTCVAGRRLVQRLQPLLQRADTRVVVTNYANGYAGYVTTPEEYDAQHYEGASTLYGRHTLDAYLEELERLTRALVSGQPVAPGAPFDVPARYERPL